METKPKIKNERNKVFTITVRFNKAQFMALSKFAWERRTFLGILGRKSLIEYVQKYGVTVPDDEIKT